MGLPQVPLDEEGRLEEVLAAYLRAMESGEAIAPEDVVRSYPDLSAELEQFFSGRAAFEQAVKPLRSILQASERHPTPYPADTLSELPAETESNRGGREPAADYEILEELGRGGMGVVFRARQRSLNRLVALKMIRASRLSSAEDIRRFRNEAESVATLDHPNIIPVYDVGELDGQLYFSMKLVEGGTLAERKAQKTEDPEQETAKRGHRTQRQKNVAQMVAAIAHAVHHAHERGILHRDLKPSNILVDKQSRPYVTDFGLAKRLANDHDLTQTGDHVGTPAYMAPEMIAPAPRSLSPRGRGQHQHTGRSASEETARPGSADPAATSQNVRPGLLDPAAYPGRPGRETCHNRPGSGSNPVACLAPDASVRRGSFNRAERPTDHPPDSPAQTTQKGPGRVPLSSGSAVTIAADIYGIGAIFYFILTGRPPFQGQTVLDTLMQLREHDPIRPSATAPRIDRDLETICLKCLQKEPGHRYPSALAVAEDLERWLRGEPIAARAASRLEYVRRWCKRNRLAAGSITLSALLLVIGVVGLVCSVLVIRAERDEALRQRERAVQGELAIRRSLYVADMKLAHHAWQHTDAHTFRDALVRHLPREGEPDLRGFEWYYLAGLDQDALLLQGHKGEVYHIEFSPDGSRVATAGKDGTIRLWDRSTGQVQAILREHRGEANWVTFSPDGSTLASAGDDGTVRLWHIFPSHDGLPPGCRLKIPAHVGDALAVAFSPNGKLLASGGADKRFKIWDAENGQLLGRFEGLTDQIVHVGFSPDGRYAAAGCANNTAKIWDLSAFEKLCSSAETRLPIETAPSRAISGEPGSKPIAARAIAFANKRPLLAVASNTGPVFLADPQKTDPATEVMRHRGRALTVRFSPDDSLLASGGDDSAARIYSLTTKEVRTILGHTGCVRYATFSPDGTVLATAGQDATARLWKVPERFDRRVRQLDARGAGGLAYSPDHAHLAIASRGGDIELFDWFTLEPKRRLKDHGAGEQASMVTLAFTPDGAGLASRYQNSPICLWDSRSGELITKLPADRSGDYRFEFLPGGDSVIAQGRAISSWDVPSGQLRWQVPREEFCTPALAVCPDGRTFATGGPTNEETVIIRTTNTGERQASLSAGRGAIWTLAYSPDGRTLISGSETGTLKFWDAATELCRAAVITHNSQAIRLACFSPDGATLATAGLDKTIRLWNVASAEQLFVVGTFNEWVAALGKLAVFSGVRKFPVRVKCATLAWHTLNAALHDERASVSTEE